MCFVRIITFQGVFAMFAADSSCLRPKHDQLWQKSALTQIGAHLFGINYLRNCKSMNHNIWCRIVHHNFTLAVLLKAFHT